MPLLLVLAVSSFPFCNSTYLPIHLPTYLSIYPPVCKSCEPILAAEPSNTIDSLFVRNFPARFWIFQNQMYRFRASVCTPSASPFVFRISKIELARKVIVKRGQDKGFFFFEIKFREGILSSFRFRVSEIIKDRCVVYERKKMTINKRAGINGIYFKQIAVKIIYIIE